MYNRQYTQNGCARRDCRFSCWGLIFTILAFLAALGIGVLIGANFAETIMAAMAAIIAFVAVIVVLIVILLIARYCSCSRDCNRDCE